jgi:hypothetical protein
MTSRFETQLADEWTRCYGEFKETVIRRVGGSDTTREEVEAIVEFDSGAGVGGLVVDDRGRQIQAEGTLEIPAGQCTTPEDRWEIRDRVYKTVGDPVSEDAASKSLAIVRTKGIIARKPRVR